MKKAKIGSFDRFMYERDDSDQMSKSNTRVAKQFSFTLKTIIKHNQPQNNPQRSLIHLIGQKNKHLVLSRFNICSRQTAEAAGENHRRPLDSVACRNSLAAQTWNSCFLRDLISLSHCCGGIWSLLQFSSLSTSVGYSLDFDWGRCSNFLNFSAILLDICCCAWDH